MAHSSGHGRSASSHECSSRIPLASGDILSLQAFERMLSEAVAEAATGEQKAALLNEAVDGVRRLPGRNDRRLVVGDYVESLRRNLEGDE